MIFNLMKPVKVSEGIEHNGTIPVGGAYYVGVTSNALGDYSGATATYTSGDEFPSTVSDGDVYVYEDYEYRYNYRCERSIFDYKWISCGEQNGWDARVLDDSKTTYREILTTINEADVTSLFYTFYECKSLTSAGVPSIPCTVENMYSTFSRCSALVDASNIDIPNCVTNLGKAFYVCGALTIAPTISQCANLTDMTTTFGGCGSLVSYSGSEDEDGDFSGYVIPNSVTKMGSDEFYTGGIFQSCTSLTKAPDLSNFTKLIDMTRAFKSCTALTTAPVIPRNVEYLSATFEGCTALTGTVVVNTNNITTSKHGSVGSCNSCFAGTTLEIVLAGDASDTVKELLVSTATNGNVTY